VRAFLHGLRRRHTIAVKDGLGQFSVCASRLPGGKCTISFRPDYSGANWHPVPAVRDDDGTLLFERMIKAASPGEAMALLRAELEGHLDRA